MSWRRWTVFGGLALVLLGGLGYWRAGQAWRGMLARVGELQAGFEAEDRRRSVLWGAAVEGTCDTDYRRAVAAVAELVTAVATATGIERGSLLETLLADPRCEPAARRALLDGAGAALEHLRRGAHRQQGGGAVDWRGGLATAPDILALYDVAHLVALQARARVGQGATADAARWVLDGMQFGRDFSADPRFLVMAVGWVVIGRFDRLLLTDPGDGADRGWPGGMLADLDRPALELLATGLARLDRAAVSLPRAMRGETLLLVRTLQQAGGLSAGGLALPWAWRFGFSSRILVADAVGALLDRAAELPDGDLPWEQARRACDAFVSGMRQRANPLNALVVPDITRLEAGRRQGLAGLRILRLAVADALGQQSPAADPFGGRIRGTTADGMVRYHSVGPDGRPGTADDIVRVR